MIRAEFYNLMKRHCVIPSELDDVFDFVAELLYLRRKELEEKEPYAVRSINALENAEHEVYDLIDYISELEEEEKVVYKMLTAAEAIDELFRMERQSELAFTFDNTDEDPDCDPSGWHSMKLTQIFDEEDYVFAIGYYGGGSTETYDIYGMVGESDNTECVKEYCTARLQNFMNTWSDSLEPCEKICVEIKRENDDV